MKPLISIIIPVYNAELYLRECLECIRDQSLDDLECILVDDGSTDASALICDEYSRIDDRFKTYHIKNGGVSNARDFGITHSSGEYITFIDSDDYIYGKTYEEVIQRINIDKSDVCCFGIRRVSKDKQIENIKFKDAGLIKNFINYDVYMHSVCNKVFRRSLIENNNITFSRDLIVCEDMLFAFKALALSSKVSYLDRNYYSYRINEQSVCQTVYTDKRLNNYKEVVEYLTEFCKSKEIYDKYRYFINYRQMCYAIQFLVNPMYYSPKDFRRNRGKHSIWIYSFRPDFFIMTACSTFYFDMPARIFIELKKKRLRMKSKRRLF